MKWEEINPNSLDGIMAIEALTAAFLKGVLDMGDDFILVVYEKPKTLFNKEKLMGSATSSDVEND